MIIPRWKEFDPLFIKYGDAYGVNWKWLKAIALNESFLGNEPRVAKGLANPANVTESISRDGRSWGLMQMTLPTAKDFDLLATAEKLNKADYSIDLATQYVCKLMKMFNSLDLRHTEWVIKSYNQGQNNTRKEIDGKIKSYAEGYWIRFKKNLNMVEVNP